MAYATSMQKKVQVIYSPQQIVDCAYPFGTNGCNGGWMSSVYNFAKAVNVARESSYIYYGTQRLCLRTTSGPYRVSSYAYTTTGSCTALFNRVTLSPVVVAVAVGSSTGFMSYKSGILSLASCPVKAVDHAIVVVGYDANSNWKILNSWGTTWGVSGYANLAVGNTCNICQYGGYYSTLA